MPQRPNIPAAAAANADFAKVKILCSGSAREALACFVAGKPYDISHILQQGIICEKLHYWDHNLPHPLIRSVPDAIPLNFRPSAFGPTLCFYSFLLPARPALARGVPTVSREFSLNA